MGLILECPNLQLQEVAYKVEEITGTVVSTSTLCRLLGRHGFTHKKIQCCPTKKPGSTGIAHGQYFYIQYIEICLFGLTRLGPI